MESIEEMKVYAQGLGSIEIPEQSKVIDEIAAKLATATLSAFLFTGLDTLETSYFFLQYLVAAGYPRYLKIRCYDVVEIHFDHFEGVKNTEQLMRYEALLLWGGFHDPEEGEHRRYQAMLMDVIDRRMAKGKRTCVAFHKGRFPAIERELREYPRIAVEELAVTRKGKRDVRKYR